MEVKLAGKLIFITGGTSVLGRAFVRKATQEGARVFFTYHRNVEEAGQLEKAGATGFQLDLVKRRDIDELKKKIQSQTRELDALVHNAAIVRDHTVQNMTAEEWDDVLSVDLSAVYYLTKKFLSFLFKKPGSRILNVVSRLGLHGGFGEANYAAAKGGLIALTKTLAQELGGKHILVNGLNPGFMIPPPVFGPKGYLPLEDPPSAEKTGGGMKSMTESLPDKVIQRNIDESVLGTISDPEEVSDFMIYLLSDRVRNVSGQIFHFESRRI